MTRSLGRVFRFGMQNYLRNGWLSLAATLVVAMTLFIVSFFTLQAYVTKTTTEQIGEKLDMSIYINDGPSEEEVAAFVNEVKAYPEVRELTYLNKQQVIEEWNKLLVDQRIKEQVSSDNNPLPRTIKLKANDPELLDIVERRISESTFSSNIQDISFRNNRPVVEKFVTQSKKATKNGVIVSGIFIAIAILFVYNTIRIIIRFRDEEISIMKLVGATDSFVRGPFMVEGSLYGLIAGLIALVALYLYLQNGLTETAAVVNPDSYMAQQVFTFFQANLFPIGAALIGAAILLSIFCSWISVHHHLKR